MDIAKNFAKQSTCISKQVGGILVKDGRIIYSGYNGVPCGKAHCNEIFSKNFDREEHHQWSNINELHCEQNIISGCAKNGIITNDTDLYVTLSPCMYCAKLIVAAGIKKVIYLEKYDKSDSISFLIENNIQVIKWVINEN